jgi:hypothetical protein
MRRALLGLAALLSMATAAWAEEPRQRVMDVPLDMPMDDPLDGEFLEGIYEDKLHDILKDSVLIGAPIQHIESHFTEDRTLELWFSSKEDGRRVFWARLSQSFERTAMKPETTLANFEAIFGKPDKVAQVKNEQNASWILLKLDPRLGDERRGTILRLLDVSFNPTPEQVGDFAFMDMRDRVKLLTPDFRGAVFYVSAFKGKVGATQTDLIDMVRAQSVLNLTPP